MSYDRVLVRAAAGEPMIMLAVSANHGLVYVANPESIERVEAGLSWPVGVPQEDVFHLNEAAYAELRKMWERSGRLNREDWRRFRLDLLAHATIAA